MKKEHVYVLRSKAREFLSLHNLPNIAMLLCWVEGIFFVRQIESVYVHVFLPVPCCHSVCRD